MDGLDLKIMRITQGIKAKELALLLNVSNAYISMVENNKETPSDNTYKKWIEILSE